MQPSRIRAFFIAALVPFVLATVPRSDGQGKSENLPEVPLAFEVASIKRSDPNASVGQIRPLPGGQTYISNNIPVKLIILLMYRLNGAQVFGGPGWMETDRWDIEAKAGQSSNIDQLHEMFRTLLADRFKLTFHTETRELPMLALSIDKQGTKMKLNESPNTFEIAIKLVANGKIRGERASIDYLAWLLSQMLDRPVVNKTGLDRFYDFTLEWMPELPSGFVPQPEVEVPNPDRPDIFTALREQLGLKLENQKGPVQVMVIDHVEMPSEN